MTHRSIRCSLSPMTKSITTRPLFSGFRDKTFLEYLNTKNLTPIVQHYVVQAIAMATDKTSCRDGVNRTKHFLNSLGRYGNTPFLWPMYGSGELPQCFCRYASNTTMRSPLNFLQITIVFSFPSPVCVDYAPFSAEFIA